MKKKVMKVIILYVLVTLVLVLGDKFFGNGYRAKLGPNETRTWQEIIDSFPVYLVSSAVITIFYVYLFSKIKKE